ncbi:3-isopropylmalate dehydratase large subunit [Mesorhizobium sp. M7A.F.Ca.CA.001.09.2.1]|nr:MULTISPECIES: 3-isopropylmalate dehydratase large subunit [unclassified Mesorhizobium]RUU80201.1 3-isopropylmalate dehydratase large subunit [Mesorhizobium sp. M7A.F.Ca.MR.362.00.0.0]RUY59220.1 3-isopropylmalate dehydratase large subunit [Mesorhizobium sp. M7A.F.Ca.CA.001.13.2.1]RUY68592.1 3-isopropylmalate dehydratase large subunit [Mesorhizobium sp. M7A.F.Ca.CA.001.05.1.1]RUY72915.1 3-isopropylmalate dehydratase large subunit [Mesorhizobium sp. M7A.F.Ca.CA.001.13.1.1]RUZ10471.1 3-isopropy
MSLGRPRAALTMLDKIWSQHSILDRADGETLLYVDRHLIHDGYQPAFEFLRARGLRPRAPHQIFGTPDHYVPTDVRQVARIPSAERRGMVESLMENAKELGFTVFELADSRQGIVHVIGPEQGISQPGMTIVCADSHTSTHGALGALAFGVGMTQATQVLATQTLWQRKPKSMRISVEGELGFGVSAKDVILAIIRKIGAAGAVGYVIEYAGSAIRDLTMEGRLTVCNMSIEAGARAGMIAPDQVTFDYVRGRPYSPSGEAWDKAVERWSQLGSDPDAVFDREVTLDAAEIAPMVTWGTSLEDVAPIDALVPDPDRANTAERREAMSKALTYMGLEPGTLLAEIPVDRVFIGSCTNGRIEDLRSAAAVVKGRTVHPRVEAWIVPGSGLVKAQAEAEGLDSIFLHAGFEWREAGCSLCLGTNGETVASGKRCASTSNRNFVGRQGRGARTHLMSPTMAAAAAITGHLTDVRQFQRGE